MKEMGKFIENHDRSLRKARANIPLNNLTANTNVPPAEVKNLGFPAPGVVGCKIPTYQKKIMKKKIHRVGTWRKPHTKSARTSPYII